MSGHRDPTVDLMPIREAAKAIGKARAYVRGLVDAGKLTAYRVGGTDKAPRLRVSLPDLQRAHRLNSVYRPPATGRRQRTYVVGPLKLDPLVEHW